MSTQWNVKYTGLIDLLIFSYGSILIVYGLFILNGTNKHGGDVFENIWMSALLLFPITLAIITMPLSWARKKKVPKSILVDKSNNKIHIKYFRKHDDSEYLLNDIAYNFIDKNSYVIFTVYVKEIATRGHILYFELFNIFAPALSTSWDRKKVFEIINSFKELNIENHVSSKPKSLIDTIFD